MTQTAIPSQAPAAPLTQFNPSWPELWTNPYPVYDRYREQDPLHWGVATNPALPGSWYTFTYDDCMFFLGDKRFKSDPASVGKADAYPKEFEPVAHVFMEWLGALDAPKHTRIRSIMAKTFTPRRIRELEPRVQTIANELLDDVLGTGTFDLVSSFTFPLPMAVIGDMLGVPEADRDQFKKLSTEFAKAIDSPGDPEAATMGAAAANEMLDYFAELLALRKKNPTDDLMTAMMEAATDDGEIMSPFEILATAIELIVAGHETTVNTVAKSTYFLLHDESWASVAENPDQLTGEAVEELLRWTSPLQRQRNRWVTEPLVHRDKQLNVGDAVVVMLGAANYDPAMFPDPAKLDFTRPAARHMTFGHGPHLCLGAHLARMEVTVALRTLMQRAPKLELRGEPEWRKNALIPGPEALPVGA